MDELKTCPFCGGSAMVFENSGAGHQMPVYGVACMNCSARVYGYAQRSVAEMVWNRRVNNGQADAKD